MNLRNILHMGNGDHRSMEVKLCFRYKKGKFTSGQIVKNVAKDFHFLLNIISYLPYL